MSEYSPVPTDAMDRDYMARLEEAASEDREAREAPIQMQASAEHVLVRRITQARTAGAGLFLPEVKEDKPIQRGVVLSIGPAVRLEDISYALGDTVMYMQRQAIGPLYKDVFCLHAGFILCRELGIEAEKEGE